MIEAAEKEARSTGQKYAEKRACFERDRKRTNPAMEGFSRFPEAGKLASQIQRCGVCTTLQLNRPSTRLLPYLNFAYRAAILARAAQSPALVKSSW